MANHGCDTTRAFGGLCNAWLQVALASPLQTHAAMSVPSFLAPAISSLLLSSSVAGCISFEGGSGSGREPEAVDASVDEPVERDAAGEPPPSFSCDDVDAELSQNCDIERNCREFAANERNCIDDVMSLEWARPPCEEYAECLSIPLFDCEDIEDELTANCAIELTCSELSFAERFCLSALMDMLWSDPPCSEYSACLIPR